MKNLNKLAGMKKAVTFATAVFCMVGTFAGTTSVFATDDTQSAVSTQAADTAQTADTSAQASDATATQTTDSTTARTVPHYDVTKDGGTWDGATYHLVDGSLATQCFFTDGTYTYYLQNDGTAMKDRLTYHPDGEHLIYFDTNGHEVFDNFQFCKDVGYTCYFNTYGYAYFDQVTFKGNKAYYLDKTGKMQQSGWFQFGNGVDYGCANTDGTLITNQFGTDPWGRQVFYHWNGMVARGLITDGAWYYNMDATDGHYLGQFSVESVQKMDASSHLKYVYYSDKTAAVVGLDDDMTGTTQNFTLNIPQTISHDGVTYTVTSIANYAFSKWNTATFKDDRNPENVYLTKVTLPDTVTLIQQYAFQGCTNLQEINLPSHLTEIGDSAFESCSSLTQVVFPSTLTTIGDDAFKSDSSLFKVTLNEGLTNIGSNVFDSTALTSIKIPSTWTSIPGGMFCNTKLASVNIPDSITEIGGGAFENTQLKSVIIPSHVTELGGSAFAETPLTSITIPDSVTNVGINLFQDCKNLTSVTWGKGLTSLPSNMFEGCTAMTTLDVPEGISSLDCFVFKGMTNLKTVTLPDSLTYIAPYDFQGDTSLDKVTVGNKFNLVYEKAFDGVTSLTKLDIRNSTHDIDYIPFSIVDNKHDKTNVDASSVKDANGNILLQSVYKDGYAGTYFNAYELKFTK